MLNGWRLLLAGLVAMIVLSTSTPAFADTPAPMSSYKKLSPDGAYVFVMLGRYDFGASSVSEWKGYSQSGLYLNDSSKEPLWTVDWFAYDVDIASDGIHLVRHGALAMDVYAEAISFYANGELIRSYRINELVDNERALRRSVTFLHWRSDGWLIDLRQQYVLKTLDGKVSLFDITTGDIVSW